MDFFKNLAFFRFFSDFHEFSKAGFWGYSGRKTHILQGYAYRMIAYNGQILEQLGEFGVCRQILLTFLPA